MNDNQINLNLNNNNNNISKAVEFLNNNHQDLSFLKEILTKIANFSNSNFRLLDDLKDKKGEKIEKTVKAKFINIFVLQIILEFYTLFNLLLNENSLQLHQTEEETKAEDSRFQQTLLQKFNLKIASDTNFVSFLKDFLLNLKHKSLGQELLTYNWQIAIIEREKEQFNTKNKLDQVEIDMQFSSFDNNSSEYKKSLLNLNYYEFKEIFNNLKKIDGQLHLFKN